MIEVAIGPNGFALDILGIIQEREDSIKNYELTDYLVTPGCSPLNVAVGLRRLGHSTGVFGVYATDQMGLYCKASLDSEGIDTNLMLPDKEGMTYTAFVLVESLKHRRTIFANTRSKLAEMVINEDIRNFIKSTSLYGTHGGFLYDEHNAGRIIDLFKWAYENGVATFIDPSEDPEQQILDSLRPILKYLKVFIPGYKEALLLTGTDDVVDAARILLSYGPEIVVVKLSQEGSLVVTKSELYYSQGFIVDDKDLTGAGDGFASGFFHGILKGWSLIDSITFGNAYAANNIMHLGPRAGMVSEKETFEFIKRFKSHRHNKIQKFTDYFNDK